MKRVKARTPTPFQQAFLAALARRCRDRGGQIVLPTGTADAAEIAKVLAALDRVHQYTDVNRKSPGRLLDRG